MKYLTAGLILLACNTAHAELIQDVERFVGNLSDRVQAVQDIRDLLTPLPAQQDLVCELRQVCCEAAIGGRGR